MSWTTDLELFAQPGKALGSRRARFWMARLLRPHLWSLAGALAVSAAGVAVALLQPFLVARAVDVAIGQAGPTDRAGGEVDSLAPVALALVAIALVHSGVLFVQARGRARLAQDLLANLRSTTFARVQGQPYGFFVHASPGAIHSRLWHEAFVAANAVPLVVTDGATAVLTFLAGPLVVAVYDWRLAILLLSAALVLVPMRWTRQRIRGHVVRQAVVHDQYAGFLQERISVSGALLGHVFATQERDRAQQRAWAESFRSPGAAAASWQAANQALIAGGLELALAAVVWFGGNRVLSGGMTLGTLALLLFYTRIISLPIQAYGQLRFEVIRGAVAFNRLVDVLGDGRSHPGGGADADADGSPPPTRLAGSLEFRDVQFRYPSPRDLVPESLLVAGAALPGRTDGARASTLEGISFTVDAGSLVALVGPSGSGKSTIAMLAAGLWAPDTGQIVIGGIDAQEKGEATLRRSVGLVTQDVHLFHDTIRNNLLLAKPDASDKQLVRACVAAGIHRFVRCLPNGYGTIVGERGVRLSGGQRQRLAFARLLLLDPPIVILDEAMAHLDVEAEAVLQEAVGTILADRTRLVIAHRLSTVMTADQIVVLEEGRIVERGGHHTLMAAGGRYHDLCQRQLLAAGSRAAEGGDDVYEVTTMPGRPAVEL